MASSKGRGHHLQKSVQTATSAGRWFCVTCGGALSFRFLTHSTALYRDVAVTGRGCFVLSEVTRITRGQEKGRGRCNIAFGLAGEKRGSAANLTWSVCDGCRMTAATEGFLCRSQKWDSV